MWDGVTARVVRSLTIDVSFGHLKSSWKRMKSVSYLDSTKYLQGNRKIWPDKNQKIEMRLTCMTKSIWPKLGLEHEQKKFRITNLNNCALQKFTTLTTINFTPQKYAGAISLDKSRSPGLQAHTGWDTCPALLRFFTIKTSGTEVRRTQDIILGLSVSILVMFNC